MAMAQTRHSDRREVSGDQSSRLPRGQRALRFAVAAAGLSLVLVVVDAALFLVDQSARRSVNQRQQTINEGAQLSRVDQILVRALAVRAANAQDATLRDLLNRNGVTFQVSPPPAAPAPAKD